MGILNMGCPWTDNRKQTRRGRISPTVKDQCTRFTLALSAGALSAFLLANPIGLTLTDWLVTVAGSVAFLMA